MKVDYGYSRHVPLSFEEAQQRVRETLQHEGFGVLTEIDVTATLKQKIDADLGRRYVILGACNPKLAHQALQSERDIGLLLPCNVIVYEQDEGCIVAALDPEKALGIVQNEGLQSVAKQAGEHLRRAVDAI